MSALGQILTPRSAPACLLLPNADIAMFAGSAAEGRVVIPGCPRAGGYQPPGRGRGAFFGAPKRASGASTLRPVVEAGSAHDC
jgi:hypothetical protein